MTTVPAKVQRLINIAERQRLDVTANSDDAWTVDDGLDYGWCVWIYYTPGARGGRIICYLYSKINLSSRRMTIRAAVSEMATMGDHLRNRKEAS